MRAQRAKKLGIRVLFGEQGNVLWVTLAQAALSVDGIAEAPLKKSAEDIVLEALREKRDTSGVITSWARSNGAPGIGISDVDRILIELMRAGSIRLKARSSL